MKLSPLLLPATLIFVLAATGCASTTAPDAEPSTDQSKAPDLAEVKTDPSCPASVKLNAVPMRIVTLDAGAAAILIELGVGDKIVGTAGPDFIEDFDGKLREKLEAIEVIDPGQGNAEAVINAKPDFVTGISEFQFGKFDGTATVEQLEQAGASALSACGAVQDEAMDNIDETYRYIAALAEIFGVTERGEELIDEIRAAVTTASEKTADADVPVFIMSMMSMGPDAGKGVMTNGGTSFANGVIALAGGRNIAAEQLKAFVNLSPEEIVAADPKVIVVLSGFSAQSAEELKTGVAENPLLAETTAVKEGNIVVVPQRYVLSPSLLNAKAVAAIADAVDKAS